MNKPLTIGVDLGGTNTVFGIVNPQGDILCEGSIKTKVYSTPEEFADAGVECIKGLLESHKEKFGFDDIRGIGIGAPNGNYLSGCIEFAANLQWKGVIPLAQLFKDRLGLPVYLTNDANAAAIGEMKYGAARGMKDFIVITLGTGVGSGIVANGQLIYGHDGFAGELGHIIMIRGEQGRPCGCGRRGCLETYCSATGVARTAREILATTDKPSILREKDPDDIESLDVSIAASKGDEVAKEIFQYTGEMLGAACADFAAFSSPEAFIFFGGLAKAGDLIMKPIEESYNRNALKIYQNKPKFLISELMDKNAAILGASAIVE